MWKFVCDIYNKLVESLIFNSVQITAQEVFKISLNGIERDEW